MGSLVRAKAPLRLSFAGGGTDVPPFPEREGGVALNTTINRYAYASLTPRKDGQIHIRSLDFGLSLNYSVEDKLDYDGRLDLAKAAILNMGAQKSSGFDIFLHAAVPPGSGLGASSAMMVSIVGVLKEFKQMHLTKYATAKMAHQLERVELKISGGMQDQYSATFGGFNFMEFHKDDVVVTPLQIPVDVVNELEYNMLLAYTGETRLSAGIIDDQVKRYIDSNEVSMEALREMKHLTTETKNALIEQKLRRFAELLDEGWQAKKKLSSKISTDFIDEVYDESKKAGAIGGKLSGAGGGGYLLLYCQPGEKYNVAQRVSSMGCTPTDFDFTNTGLQTWKTNDD